MLLAGIFLAGCAAVPTQPVAAPEWTPGAASAPSQVTPHEALAMAEALTHHQWRPFARNILHGPDAGGVRVDTPDAGYHPPSKRNGWWVPGEINEGIPYKWGGFDDPASFDGKVAAGFAAGDVATPEKRRADNAAVSAQAAGVDCSGFVAKCLKLPGPCDSAQLPFVCDVLPDAMDLRPGDVLNIPRRHAMLVAGWAKPDKSWILYYENGGVPEWKPALKQAPLAALLKLGYQPLRYRGMARETVPSGKEILTRAMRAKTIVVENPVVGDP